MVNTPPHIPDEFLSALTYSLKENKFIKITLGKYRGDLADLKNIYVRKVNIKGTPHLTFTSRFQRKDIVKNYLIEAGLTVLVDWLSAGFQHCTVFTLEKDLVLDLQEGPKFRFRQVAPTLQSTMAETHDKSKNRPISTLDKPYLHALQITDALGAVYKNAQDKYRQINHFINVLRPLLSTLPKGVEQRILDMGSGKGYLTFALYDYLRHVLGLSARVTGVEFRSDLVDLCNRIAVRSGFAGLDFVEGSIADYSEEGIDMLIALHACDTATDDAIAKGIRGGAALIVVAPCCHKQIRKEMSTNRQQPEIAALTDHGIFLERQAEMVTDSLRSLILEYYGYQSKVFEFISDAHTPKNVLIIGKKTRINTADQERIAGQIEAVKTFYGIGYHYLERIMRL